MGSFQICFQLGLDLQNCVGLDWQFITVYFLQTLLRVLYITQLAINNKQIKVMKQNISLGMNRPASLHKGVPKYSDKYKDILQRAYKREQIIKPQLKQLFFYRIRSIGVGAFSFVYLVSEQSSGTVFAQKSVSKKSITPELFTEIKLHLSLSHSNIVNMYHIYSQQNYVQLIMDYGGQSLFSLRKNNKLPKLLSEQKIVSILRQLISAVGYLHNRMIVHADIKLQNILYFQGVVKLCDFGFAHIAKKQQSEISENFHQEKENFQRITKRNQGQRLFSSQSFDSYCFEKQRQKEKQKQKDTYNNSVSKDVVGTLQYLDPQYVQGRFSQFSRDIWAIGVVAYELAVGKNPFEGMQQNQKWSTILKIKQIDLKGLEISKKMHKFLQLTLCSLSTRANIKQLQRLELFQHLESQKKILESCEVKILQ